MLGEGKGVNTPENPDAKAIESTIKGLNGLHELEEHDLEVIKVEITINSDGTETKITMEKNNNHTYRMMAIMLGFFLVVGLIMIIILIPNPTSAQNSIFRGAFALGGGGFASCLTGMMDIKAKFPKIAISATGAFAAFVLLYYVGPATT